MSNKKKILTTAGIGTAAIVAGVVPTISSTTSIQSSSVAVTDPVNPVEPIEPVVNPVDDQFDPLIPIDPEDPVDPVEPIEPIVQIIATAPSHDTFVYDIKISQLSDSYLNNYLQNLFTSNDFFKETFINAEQYDNVTVSYVANSASLATSSFKIAVSPIEGANWEDKTDESKIVDIFFDNDIKVANATIPKKGATFNVSIVDPTIKTDGNLNTYLTNLFKNNPKITDFAIGAGDTSFMNVNLTYVNNSASLNNKTFKLNATPVRGYTWSSVMGEIADTVQINVKIGNMISANNTINFPTPWSVNWVINSDFSFRTWPTHILTWENISWFFETGFDYYWYANNPRYYDNLSAQYQKLMFEEAYKDFSKYVPVDLAGDLSTVQWGYIQRINQGVLFNFAILVKPKTGYYWEDGSTTARYKTMKLFCSSKADVGAASVIGKTYNINDIKNFNNIKTSDGLPANIWVTNNLMVVNSNLTSATFQQNQKIIHDIVKTDLERTFPNYNIEVSDIFSATPGYPYNYYGTWHYKIKFTSKDNKSYTKTMDGYLFTI
ncbi:MAG: hypothetical protein K2G48_01195 [Malacoplasma sp.]|nr:hypothetical protein [Malacoplasma sp.]